MKTPFLAQSSRKSRASQRGVGTLVNTLLLGVLAGLIMGQSTSAAHMTLVMTFTFAALGVSLLLSKLIRHLKKASERRAFERTVFALERRMDRLIPRRHMKAHGMHTHRPHSLDESESNWMPVARQSRLAKRQK